MKVDRLRLYLLMCEGLKVEPTFEGVNNYDKSFNGASNERELHRREKSGRA